MVRSGISPCRHVSVYEDSALVNKTDVTNLLVDEFILAMDYTGGYASWLNGNNVLHNRIIHNMVRSGLIDSNQHGKNGVVQQKHKLKLTSIVLV